MDGPLGDATSERQTHRLVRASRKQGSGYYGMGDRRDWEIRGLWGGTEMFPLWRWSHGAVNVLKTTALYTLKGLKRLILLQEFHFTKKKKRQKICQNI